MTTQTTLTLLDAVIQAAREAGARLLEIYSPQARPRDRSDLFAAGRRNEEVSLAVLTPALTAARPGARWVDDDQETTALPPGEWWSVDAVEGNVNHVHGQPQWCVSIALIRDGVPVLAVVRQPAADLTYTAVRGGGAFLGGLPLHVSPKVSLDAAIVATGQAEAGQDDTYRRIGESVTAMLGRALLVRATVPSTFPLLDVAAAPTCSGSTSRCCRGSRPARCWSPRPAAASPTCAANPGRPAPRTSWPPRPPCTPPPSTSFASHEPHRPRVLGRHRARTHPPGARTVAFRAGSVLK